MVSSLKNKSLITILSLTISLIALIVFVIAVIFFSNKGFETSDEAYYLFFSEHTDSTTYLAQNFGVFNKMACFGYPSIINLRLAKLICQSTSVIIFTFCLLKYLKNKNIIITTANKILVFILMLMSSFVNYDYLPMTMSYNTWTLIFSLFGFSIILLELIYKTKTVQLLTSTGIGFIVFCLFLVKFPNAIMLVCVYGLIILMFNRNYLLLKLLMFFIGAALSFITVLHNFNFLLNIIHNYKVALFDIKHMSGSSYINQVIDFLNLCGNLGYIRYELLIIVLILVIRKFNKTQNIYLNYLPIILNFCIAIMFFKGNSQQLYNDFIIMSLLLCNIFIYMFLNPKKSSNLFHLSEVTIVSILLILMPIMLMLGTNNLFYYTASQTICFSIAGIILLFFCNSKIDNIYLSTKTLFVCAFICTVNYFGAIKTPYRQTNLLKKIYPIHFHRSLNGIFESEEKYVDFSTLNFITNKLCSNKGKIFTFFNYFGLYYIANKNMSVQCPVSDGKQYIYATKYVLTLEKFNDSAELIIIPSTVNNNPDFHKMFNEYGIYLGDNYKLKYTYTFSSSKEVVYFYKKIS